MTLLLPRLQNKNVEPSIRVWRQRRALVAPIGKVFPKSPGLSDEPDETLDLTTVSLAVKYIVDLPEVRDEHPSSPQDDDGGKEYTSTPNLPELPGRLPGERRGPTSTKPPVVETPHFCLKGEARRDPRYGEQVYSATKIETSPAGMALKNICSQLQPWLQSMYGANVDEEDYEEELRKLLFVKKMRIYLEVRKKAYSPEVRCIPIFHCPRCLEHWTITGAAPETCDNEVQPTRGPEVIVKGTKLRFIPMYPKEKRHRLTKEYTMFPKHGPRKSKTELSGRPFLNVHRKTHHHTTSTSHFLAQKHETSRDTMLSRDVAERIGVKEELVQTAPGVFTVTEETGEKFHINEEILKTLQLDGLNEDEAIQLFIESGAIVLEGMIPREPSTNLVKALSFTDDQYDEYARVGKRDCSPTTKTDSRQYEAHAKSGKEKNKLVSRPDVKGSKVDSAFEISRETDHNISHQESFSSSVDGTESSFDLGIGEKFEVNVKFGFPRSTYNTKYIRVKDLPDSIRNKLLSLLYAQRQKKGLEKERKDHLKGEKKGSFVDRREWKRTDESHTMMENEPAEKDSRRISVGGGSRQANFVYKESYLKQSRKGIESKREPRDKGQDTQRQSKELTQGSTTQTQDKRSVPKPTIVWEAESNLKLPDESIGRSTSSNVLVPKASQTKRQTNFSSVDHFKEASEALNYTEKRRRRQVHAQYPSQSETPYNQPTGKTPLGTRPSQESTVPRRTGKQTKTPGGIGRESFSYGSHRRSSSLAWSDVDSLTQISTHKTNTRKDSKTGEIVTHHDSQKRTSRINKKERKDTVRRPPKGRRTSQETENTTDNHSHVHVADATSWFEHEDTMLPQESELELTDHEPVLKLHVQKQDERTSLSEIGKTSSLPKYEKRRTSKVSKRDSVKVEELEDDFHVVMGDIRNEAIERDSEPPPMISVIEEKEEQAEEMFEEIQNPSKGSLFTNWNFNEIYRLPVSSAFTFSFYELPAQHRQFADKLKKAAEKLSKKKEKLRAKKKKES